MQHVFLTSLSRRCCWALLALFFGVLPTIAYNDYDFVVDGIKYRYVYTSKSTWNGKRYVYSEAEAAGFYNFRNILTIPATVTDGHGTEMSVTRIRTGAFAGYDLLKVQLPASIHSIGSSAFRSCTGLTSITLPEGLTTIGKEAFRGCTGLTSLTLPEGLKTIKESTFFNCSLQEVTFPTTLTWIGSHAFGSNNLRTVRSYAMVAPTLKENAFNLYGITLHLVPGATGYNQNPWSYAKQVEDLTPPPIRLLDTTNDFTGGTSNQSSVDYIRTYTHTDWQPLFVPFDVKVEDLGDAFEVARLSENQAEEGVVAFVKLKTGETLSGNSIALIRAKQTGKQTLHAKNIRIYAPRATTTMAGDYEFRDTRTRKYNLLGTWVMARGKLHPAAAEAELGAFRWYLKYNGSAPTQGLTLRLLDGDTVTTLERLAPDANGHSTIYGLDGRPTSNTPGKIRIVNGKKVM